MFLDRDGVINREVFRDGRPTAPFTVAEFEILPGVQDGLARLRDAGFLLIVVTNQPDVVRGLTSREEVEAIHSHLRQTLAVDGIRVCYHDDADGCACRKPSPGMLYAAAVEHDIALSASYMVGDRWRDVGAGRNAGCATILVLSDRAEPTTVTPDSVASDLSHAATLILSRL